ncbi:glycosyltransferase family protein [Methanolacinia paynteri]|uniref:glycosyltransferase family protein n=1 Tax=Methanolacinia paynteri TaxID=230356 RepID=UPI00064ED01C|nr:glycosyltransferase family protein [Methanolacinia paynteri]
MKILFVVCGEGLGHASRSTKLARYLENFGHTCIFASYGKAYDYISRQGGFQVYETPGEVKLEGDNGYFSISRTLWSSKGVMINLGKSLQSIRHIITEHSIDLLVSDTMYGAVTAAKLESIPSVFITNQNSFSTADDSGSRYWKALSKIVGKYLTVPDRVIVPDFEPPHTVCEYNLKLDNGYRPVFDFVGPIIDSNMLGYELKKETIFASFGGEPFKVPLYHMLKKIADERPFHTFEAFSTTPGLPDSSNNFRVYSYVDDIHRYMAHARVVILHGGLTSLHESLLFNKPCVMIVDPHHPEQWNNARKIEEMGAGILLEGDKVTEKRLSDAIDEALTMKVPDMTHLFNSQDGKVKSYKVIEELMANPGYPKERIHLRRESIKWLKNYENIIRSK